MAPTTHCAVLVVDMQVDFCADNGLLARRGVDLSPITRAIPRSNALVSLARARQVPIFWVGTEHSFQEALSNYLSVHLGNLPEDKRQEHELLVYAKGEGTAWHPELTSPEPSETVLFKTMYSAFRGTRLSQLLDAQGIRTLLLAGCNTNVCIHSSALDAFFEGYFPILCSDACATADAAAQEPFLETHRRFYGHVVSTEGLTTYWGNTTS